MKPTDLYSNLIADGQLSFDKEQKSLLERLDKLNEALIQRSKSWFKRKSIKGLYIRGEVGRGKTQMMDIFFETLDLKKKKQYVCYRHNIEAELRKAASTASMLAERSEISQEHLSLETTHHFYIFLNSILRNRIYLTRVKCFISS